MFKCLNCSTEIKKEDVFCKGCGCPIVHCPNCGGPIVQGDCFCENCGIKLETIVKPVTTGEIDRSSAVSANLVCPPTATWHCPRAT